MFDTHRSDRFYLRLNGRPAHEFTVLTEPLLSAQVVPTGDRPVHVRVAIDGRLIGELSAASGLATELIIGEIDRGVLTVDLVAGGRRRSFEVYVQTSPTMEAASLDAAIRSAQEPLARGLAPLWRPLLADAHRRRPGSLERRYLEGFCEYLMAADLDRAGNHVDAGHAIERAWGQLVIFGSDLARSTIAILAFRLDAFAFLTSPVAASSLAGIAGYFLSPPQPDLPVPGPRHDAGIWIDDFQEALIEAARHAIESQFAAAQAALDRAPRELSAAAGNERKSLILKARISVGLEDLRGAETAYSALRSDPMYSPEAEAWLR